MILFIFSIWWPLSFVLWVAGLAVLFLTAWTIGKMLHTLVPTATWSWADINMPCKV